VVKACIARSQASIGSAQRDNRELTEVEVRVLQKRQQERIEKYLDAGHGECWLKRDDIAKLVADALHHFDGKRYRLICWCIMPNHVHGVLEPLAGHDLPQIMHSLKRYTAQQANRMLGRTGAFWHAEYYDHLVRGDSDLRHAIEYAWENPENAGFSEWAWRGKNELLINELFDVSDVARHGLKTRATAEEPEAT